MARSKTCCASRLPCKHPPAARSCHHDSLTLTPCSSSRYKQPSPDISYRGSTPASRITPTTITATPRSLYSSPATFPAPLALPDDDLDCDPKYPPQNVRQWKTLQKEAPVTESRKILYVIAYPQMRDESIRHTMGDWTKAKVPKSQKNKFSPSSEEIGFPMMDHVVKYLRAFFHGMEVKPVYGWQWSQWESGSGSGRPKARRSKDHIALLSPAQMMYQVGYRSSPDGLSTQLSLNDVLDAMIDSLPSDAHSVVMLTQQDLYEDEEDDFCCGRAYGGSRVCVVSAFRYHPWLDTFSNIDDAHSWPASHCTAYTNALCPGRSSADLDVAEDDSPMSSAVKAAAPLQPTDVTHHRHIFLARFCKTVSHEIGHCLTIDHCTYFACVMQGTSTIIEDMRQPPYLCPVCLEKVSIALSPLLKEEGEVERKSEGAEARRRETVDLQKRWIRERYRRIVDMCTEYETVAAFAGWKAWCEERLAQIAEEAGDGDEDEDVET